jgi:hypothetical protein
MDLTDEAGRGNNETVDLNCLAHVRNQVTDAPCETNDFSITL